MVYLKKYLGYIIVLGGIIGMILLNTGNKTEEQTVVDYSDLSITTLTESQSTSIMVDIKGEVRYPGLYQVSENLRIGDVIAIAGGVTENADLTTINLAKKVEDEMEITIPKLIVSTTPVTTSKDTSQIVVEIKGAVVNPGLYYLPAESRVDDLIEAAGGFKSNADQTGVELARILTDGESITIPVQETEINTPPQMIYVKIQGEIVNPDIYYVDENIELKDLIAMAGGVTENADLSGIDWDIELCLGAVVTIPSLSDHQTVYSEYDENGLININYAGVETLIQLPGIGDILAQRIVDYRSENGNFTCIEDIMNVSGIKSSVYEQIKELITV